MPLFEPYSPATRGIEDREVRIRTARPEDAAAVDAIARTRGEVAPDLVVRLDAWIRDRDRLVVVAERDAQVVGWAMLAHRVGHDDAPDGWYVSALTVHPDWRRRRIGDRLLTELLAWPRASGSAIRSVVNAGNIPSLDLHRRHGFLEVGRAATFAGITFVGGAGVLLTAERGSGHRS